jgi:hypothetical protein
MTGGKPTLGAAALISPRRSAPMQKLNSLVKQDAGPTMTEYATTLSVVTLSCLAAFALLAAASYLT